MAENEAEEKKMAESLIWGDSWLFLPLEDFAFPPKAARNCLVDSDLSVKVSDFGMTRWASDVPKQLFFLQCWHLGGSTRPCLRKRETEQIKKLARKLKRSADYGRSMSFVGLANGGRPWRQCWPIKVFPICNTVCLNVCAGVFPTDTFLMTSMSVQ